jgi:nucleotide-binding universal stress UspA family protein
MQKILVPCDFSNTAVNAFRMSLDFAQQAKGTVHLLHVIELPVLKDAVIMPVLDFEQKLFKDLRENANAEIEKITTKYRIDGVKVISTVEFGSVAQRILNYISEQSVDLVLMGSHGASGFKEFFIGSNAEKIVRSSAVPVLVAKNYYKGPIKSIVFPNRVDIENEANLMIKVKALQNFFKAHLHIVWINTPLNFTSDTVTAERLESFVKWYKLTDCSTHVFNHQDEEVGILEFTNLVKGDLIALGTHGRKGIAHIINGSIAENLVNHADKLVWTYAFKKETGNIPSSTGKLAVAEILASH